MMELENGMVSGEAQSEPAGQEQEVWHEVNK